MYDSTGFLERALRFIAEDIDISQTQYERAETAYKAIAEHMAGSEDPRLSNSEIFPQGSFAIGTVIKPIADGNSEFDVDLISQLDASLHSITPAESKAILGDRLAQSKKYSGITEEKVRCWRVRYKGEFHLDIAPIVPGDGVDFIPDRELSDWVKTKPREFAAWFNDLANRANRRYLVENRLLAEAAIDDFPDQESGKGWVRRIVQLLKRHRDIWAAKEDQLKDFAPISIIISTLTARSFERVVLNGPPMESEEQTISRIVRAIPNLIEPPESNAAREWRVMSPVADENFANRWNEDQRWSVAFARWHQSLSDYLDRSVSSHGIDLATESLSEAFGSSAAESAISRIGEEQARQRADGKLRFLASSGALTGATGNASSGVKVQNHTFYGKG